MKIRIVLVKVFTKQGFFSFIFSIITRLSSGSSNPVELNLCLLSDRRVYLLTIYHFTEEDKKYTNRYLLNCRIHIGIWYVHFFLALPDSPWLV